MIFVWKIGNKNRLTTTTFAPLPRTKRIIASGRALLRMRATDSPAGVLVLSQHGNYPRNDIFHFDIIARFCRPIYCQELHSLHDLCCVILNCWNGHLFRIGRVYSTVREPRTRTVCEPEPSITQSGAGTIFSERRTMQYGNINHLSSYTSNVYEFTMIGIHKDVLFRYLEVRKVTKTNE